MGSISRAEANLPKEGDDMKWPKKMSKWRWKSYLKTLFSSGDWLQRERSRPVSENSSQWWKRILAAADQRNILWRKTSVLTESGLPASSAPLFVTGNLATLNLTWHIEQLNQLSMIRWRRRRGRRRGWSPWSRRRRQGSHSSAEPPSTHHRSPGPNILTTNSSKKHWQQQI